MLTLLAEPTSRNDKRMVQRNQCALTRVPALPTERRVVRIPRQLRPIPVHRLRESLHQRVRHIV